MPQTLPSRTEFTVLIAMLFATVALSIDAMLPALPEIAATMSPGAPNRAQLVVTSFVLGMGIGTLFAGPLSDRFGRRRVLLAGGALYALAALACWAAPSLEMLLIARVVQGIGAAGPRTVTLAIVRDLYSGREMAKIVSVAMSIFSLVPAVAPLMGQAVMGFGPWQGIFIAFLVFSALTMGWFALRLPETLPPERRKPLEPAALWAATREVLSLRVVRLSILVQALVSGMLFGVLSSMQGIFDLRFGRAESFPLWFALIAVVSMWGSIVNARVVVRLGMRRVLNLTFAAQIAVTGGLWFLNVAGLMPESLAFPAHILWTICIFAMMGLTLGNLNAMAMEPLGHVAGLAASVISSLGTIGSVLLAVPLGLLFDGTALPLMAGVLAYAILCLGLMRLAR
ncbi:MAG: multidrug effflux MFS transporter [Rhodobacteraceae bacterium]|nr:multidrug effflux MFS transporter [Paracoccaceae bacterium]